MIPLHHATQQPKYSTRFWLLPTQLSIGFSTDEIHQPRFNRVLPNISRGTQTFRGGDGSVVRGPGLAPVVASGGVLMQVAREDLKDEQNLALLLKPIETNKSDPHRMVVIIPFRAASNYSGFDPNGVEREKNLNELTNYLDTFLRIQGRNFRILVVEQEADGHVLNRGSLLNIGVDITRKTKLYDYVVLHDADQIPLSKDNFYQFPQRPMHLCTFSSLYLPWPRTQEMLGGVMSLQIKDFMQVNGYSNLYSGTYVISVFFVFDYACVDCS